MKNSSAIAIITTGGTIGAALAGGVTTLANSAGARNFHGFVNDYGKRRKLKFEIFAAFNKFSEDLTPADWGTVLQQIAVCLKAGFRRIIIAHGTDTLAYTASAVSLYHGDGPARICFVSAFIPSSERYSDAFGNMAAAAEVLHGNLLKPGVYVATRRNGAVDILRAQDLKPAEFDGTSFGSVYGQTAARVHDTRSVRTASLKTFPLLAKGPAPTCRQLAKGELQAVILPCYPGLSLDRLRLDRDREALIILASYHSGTVPALDLRKQIKGLRREYPKARVIAAAHPHQHVKNPYETTAALERDGLLRIYKDLQPHQIYVLALCETARGLKLDTVMRQAKAWHFSAV